MYPITNEVKALFEAEQRQILRITGTDKNGVAINITDEDIVLNSFNLDRCSCNGEKLEVGTAIASEMTFKLDNYDGRFNSVVFEGTELFAEIGIADWTQNNPTVYWIPCGYFTCYDQPRSLSTITIHALDRMARFDKLPPAFMPWTTQGGANMTTSGGTVIEFLTSVAFPIRVVDLVTRICTLCNVPMATVSRTNSIYTIPSMPDLQQNVTFRNLIQWCAGIMCSNAWINWNGELVFSWTNSATTYKCEAANRFSSDVYENDLSFSGVSYTNTQGVTIVSGSAGYTLDLTGNYLAANGISTILPNIRTYINNFFYRPFSASVINAPYLWPMDDIQVADKTGYWRRSILTNVNFGINSTTELKSEGETVQTNSGTAPSGVTNEQGFLVEQAVDKTNRKINDATTQEAIFNSLTNNGEEQALILYNGKLYLNATYIRTGTLVADFIKGGTLTLGGLNNTNGLLKVVDTRGDEIGQLGNDGFILNKGSIDLNFGAFKVTNAGALTALNATLNGALGSTGTDIDGNIINTRIANGKIRMFGTIDDGDIQSWQPNTYLYLNVFGGSNPSSDIMASVSQFEISCLGLEQQHSGNLIILAEDGDYSHQSERGKVVIRGAEVDITDNWRNSRGQSPLLVISGSARYTPVSEYITINTKVDINGNLAVNGTKSRSVVTDQYSDRLLYCYETPSPMFGDVGEGTIGEDGKCYVWLDPVFAQTITTTQYQVFLQRYGNGECWVSERKGSYFVVEGTPGMAFGWELKAKQRGFDQKRLERNDELFTVPAQTYGEDAARHIEDLKKERISA